MQNKTKIEWSELHTCDIIVLNFVQNIRQYLIQLDGVDYAYNNYDFKAAG